VKRFTTGALITLALMQSTPSFAGRPEANKEHFLKTCGKAYRFAAKEWRKDTSPKLVEAAKLRCENVGSIYDELHQWASVNDTGKGCELGVRSAMHDLALGDSHNLKDWKVYYGITCEIHHENQE
jgi:hypothetical protein